MYNQRHIKKATYPGEVISVDQLESSIPGFIGQMTGKLTRQRIIASTIFVDHASDFSYVYHQTSMTSEETLKSKLAVEKFALSHGSLENGIKRSGAGPKRTVRTPENLDKVRNVIEQDMNKPYDQIANSARRNELNMRRSSWSRATQELGLSCYRYNIWLYEDIPVERLD